MCGRYVSPDEASLEREFNLVRAEWRFPPNFNVAPTQTVPAIRVDDGAAHAVPLRWGLVPFFAKGVPGKYSTINARIETIETGASYRGPWKRGQRCILPALGFYEWHVDAAGRKQPFFIHLGDQPVFGFAGLWDRSAGADGRVIESCTIITMPANRFMAEIHNVKVRMPAILTREGRQTWLRGDAGQARAALVPYPDELMEAYEVSTRVNSPRNNDEKLLDPLPPAAA